jgi:hypothetical protein
MGVLAAMRVEAMKQKMQIWEGELTEEYGSGAAPKQHRRWVWPAVAGLIGVVGFGITAVALGWIVPEKKNTNIARNSGIVVDTSVTSKPPNQGATPGDTAALVEVPRQVPKNQYALMAESYEGYSFSDGLSGSEPTVAQEDSLGLAVAKYDSADYRSSLLYLSPIDSSRLNDYQMLRAYNHYHLGMYDLAIDDFRNLQHSKLGLVYDAQWGEVLCLLRQMPATEAKLSSVLKAIIVKKNHPKRAEALELETKIRNLSQH